MYQVCKDRPTAQNAVISTTLYSNGSGLRIRKTQVVRERAVGVVLYFRLTFFMMLAYR
jgi:hypothetical protein